MQKRRFSERKTQNAWYYTYKQTWFYEETSMKPQEDTPPVKNLAPGNKKYKISQQNGKNTTGAFLLCKLHITAYNRHPPPPPQCKHPLCFMFLCPREERNTIYLVRTPAQTGRPHVGEGKMQFSPTVMQRDIYFY